MRAVLLATVTVLVATAADARVWRCTSNCAGGSCTSSCAWFYSEQERYQQGQNAAGQALDFYSGGGMRRPPERVCTNGLESGIDPDVLRSYGCKP
jgi:hypothetical protein